MNFEEWFALQKEVNDDCIPDAIVCEKSSWAIKEYCRVAFKAGRESMRKDIRKAKLQ